MDKIAIIVINLVQEAKKTANSQIEKEISKTIRCDWMLKLEKVTVLEK